MEPVWAEIGLAERQERVMPSRPRLQGVRVGMLVEADPSTGIRVQYEGLPAGEGVPARATVPVTPHDEGRAVLLVFEEGDAMRPIITGFIQEHPVTAPQAQGTLRDVRVDGERIRLEAKEEIVLRCGKSSVTLRADGKIVVRGMEIVSRAYRTNKVKGAAVKIN